MKEYSRYFIHATCGKALGWKAADDLKETGNFSEHYLFLNDVEGVDIFYSSVVMKKGEVLE